MGFDFISEWGLVSGCNVGGVVIFVDEGLGG